MSDFEFHPDFKDLVVAFLWRHQNALRDFGSDIESAWFSGSNATITNLLKEYYSEYKKSPGKITLLELIRASYPEDTESQNESRNRVLKHVDKLSEIDLGDSEFVADKIRKFLGWNALKDFAMEVVDSLGAKVAMPDIVEKARTAIRKGEERFDPGQNWREDTYRRVYDYVNPDINPRIPTGIQHLDEMMNGGLQGGELGMLLAPPKGFKSGTMLNFAHSALHETVGKNVVYFTLELSEDLVGIRFDFRTNMMSRNQLYANPDMFYEILKARQDAIYGRNQLYIKYFPPKKCKSSTIRTHLDGMKEMGIDIGLVVVDYINLMSADGTHEKAYMELVAACTELRAVAVDYEIPIWTAVRATREAVGRRRLNISHISGAFEMVAIADITVAICQTEEEKAMPIPQCRMVPIACRNDGGDQTVICQIEAEKMCITSTGVRELDEEEFEDEDRSNRRRENRRRGGNRDTVAEQYHE